MKVYLAGGTASGWQGQVIAELDAFCYNPATLEGLDTKLQAMVERYWISQCDVVLAYFEASNPLGHGLATEMGLAAGLGKTVLFVNEKDPKFNWLAFFTGATRYENLEAAITAIKMLGG